MQNQAETLRALFSGKKPVRIVGAFNGLGARLAERAGFEGVWASGLEISTSNAVPDANILTMTENLDAARAMAESCSIPVICDCDTGYGNAANVMHMVKKYEGAGIAAVVIEDKRFPKVNSFVPGRQELAPVEEFAGKIEAAKNAQKDPAFMVFARIEALIAGWGIDEALKRADAYEKAGADGLVIHSKKKTPEEMYEFASRYKGKLPLVAIPTTYYSAKAVELYDHGYQMIIYANHGLRASIKAMKETYAGILATGSTEGIESNIVSMQEVFELQGMLAMKEDEKKYLRTKTVKAVIPAAADHGEYSDLGEVLKDKPLCMLPLGDNSILDRQAGLLRSAGINEIYVVTGHQQEKVISQDIKKIPNEKYAESHSAYSVMLGLEKVEDTALVLYSDIVFDRQILNQLLASPFDVTLVVDRAYKTLPHRDKKLDLVICDDPARNETGRRLELNTFKPVIQIGKNIDRQAAECEFIGMALFRKKGLAALRRLWQEQLENQSAKAFYEASSVAQAGLTDVLQCLIDSGETVMGMEIEHGWSEIHSVEDYERVKQFYAASAETLPAGS